MRVRFDRFYTYADLNETLEAWASEFPGLFRFGVDRDVLRGPRDPARHGDELRVRPARGEAGRLRPRADPRDGVHGHDRRAHLARPAAARLRRGREGHDGPRHAHVLRRPARQPGRRRGRPRGRALPSLERAAVPARGAAGRAPPRGRRRRRARADDAAARPERPLEAASRRSSSPRRAPAGRPRGRLLPRVPGGDDPELGRSHRLHRARPRGSRPQPQLARRLGA